MKRLLVALLALAMCGSLLACGDSDEIASLEKQLANAEEEIAELEVEIEELEALLYGDDEEVAVREETETEVASTTAFGGSKDDEGEEWSTATSTTAAPAATETVAVAAESATTEAATTEAAEATVETGVYYGTMEQLDGTWWVAEYYQSEGADDLTDVDELGWEETCLDFYDGYCFLYNSSTDEYFIQEMLDDRLYLIDDSNDVVGVCYYTTYGRADYLVVEDLDTGDKVYFEPW